MEDCVRAGKQHVVVFLEKKKKQNKSGAVTQAFNASTGEEAEAVGSL